MVSLLYIVPVLFIAGIIAVLSDWYTIVPRSEAHIVNTPRNSFVVSSDKNISPDGKRAYFAIPENFPFFGRSVRIIGVTIKEIKTTEDTYEKMQGRFRVDTSLKYKITDIDVASENYTDDDVLDEQLREVISASVRTITGKHLIETIRGEKELVDEQIRELMAKELAKWGVTLISFQLVDFRDTEDSTIISDISIRREVGIKSQTRVENAEKEKNATMKEAAAEEEAGQRVIEKDRTLAEQKEIADMKVAEREKEAEEKRYEVIKVQTIQQAVIDKEKAEIEAEQRKKVAIIKAEEEKEAEKILMEKKRLEGEGDRKRMEEQAKGEAAPIIEKGKAEAEKIRAIGIAEAEALNKKQEALNKFSENAITAMTAELIVDKDKAIGIETAKAYQNSEMKVLIGGGDAGQSGFNFAKMIEGATLVDNGSHKSLLNRTGRPNDLGFGGISAGIFTEAISKVIDTDKERFTQSVDETYDEYKSRLMDDVREMVKNEVPLDLTEDNVQVLTNAVISEVNRRNEGYQ